MTINGNRTRCGTVRIYHNPACSKSRATLALLHEHSITPEVVLYLKTPPTVPELSRLLDLLNLDPRGLMRRGEPVYRTLKLDDPSLERDALIRAMAEHPALIERPIVVCEHGARIGRPPEAVLDLLPGAEQQEA